MTTYLDQVFDISLLLEMIDAGMVKETPHPTRNRLKILNYTPQAQFSKTWNPVTLACRGLIYDSLTMQVLARPFQKFFNLGEHDVTSLPDEPYRVFEKMDGSLGILYHDGDDWAIATRGSFASEQAQWATKHLRERYRSFTPAEGCTYLFEIIYPDNRIVIDYSGMEDLVLLEVIDIETGVPAWDYTWFHWGGPIVEEHDDDSIETLVEMERPNHEGFVLVYQTGLRVKVKHDEYVAMHAVVTNTSSRTIWELLSTGKGLDDILAFVPDEFADWARQIETDLMRQYFHEVAEAHLAFTEVVLELGADFTRKDFAQFIAKEHYRPLLFLLLDGKDISEQVWKRIKPERTLPFRVEA